MALTDELAYMTATELAMRIRRRQLSPVEVVEACIARIQQRNPSLNAFVYTAPMPSAWNRPERFCWARRTAR